MMHWIEEHPDTFFEILGALWLLLSLIVGATTTTKDDTWLTRVAQILSFLQPKNAPGTLSLPGFPANRPESEREADSEDDLQDGPRNPGAGGVGRVVAGVLVLGSLASNTTLTTGCVSATQRGLNAGATVLMELSPEAADFYTSRDADCRAQHPPLPESADPAERAARRDEYDACMAPVEAIRSARIVLDRALRAAQAALNASGEEGFREMAPCLLEAARQLLHAITAFNLDFLPPELPDLISTVQEFVTSGQECSR